MYVQELVDFVRENLLDDTAQPYLWSDDTLFRLAKEAEKQACIRADLIIDKTTYSFDTVSGQSDYTISTEIIRPLSLYYTANGIEIHLDKYNLGRGVTSPLVSGMPYLYEFLDNNTIRLYYIPDDIYHIQMISSLYPPNTSPTTFDIDPAYHFDLRYYIAGQALLSPDIDSQDVNRAQLFLSKFDEAFGLKKDFKSLQRERLGANAPLATSSAKSFGFV